MNRRWVDQILKFQRNNAYKVDDKIIMRALNKIASIVACITLKICL